MKEIMKATPNNMETFMNMMLLCHTLQEKNGKDYSVQINWENDCVILYLEEDKQ